jgi:hypothetical protein
MKKGLAYQRCKILPQGLGVFLKRTNSRPHELTGGQPVRGKANIIVHPQCFSYAVNFAGAHAGSLNLNWGV